MVKKGNQIKRAKFLAIILGVALAGMLLFLVLFSYLFKDPLSSGACDLCYELNPSLAVCENYTSIEIDKINFSGVEVYPPFISYGK